jgi:hypothetical protein
MQIETKAAARLNRRDSNVTIKCDSPIPGMIPHTRKGGNTQGKEKPPEGGKKTTV